MKTVQDAFERLQRHAGVGGSCREDQFLRDLNAAIDLVWGRGEWRDTRGWGRIRLQGSGVIRLPWQWEFIRAAWECRDGRDADAVSVQDLWFREVGRHAVEAGQGVEIDGLVSTGRTRCTAFAPPNKLFRIRQRFVETSDDKLIYFGRDRDGVEVVEELAGDQVGEVWFAHLDAVNKAATSSPVIVEAVIDKWIGFLALYDARQTNPAFAEYRYSGRHLLGDWLNVRYRRRLVPPTSMRDLVPIQNFAALAFALEANNYIGKDNAKFAENLRLAEEQLGEELDIEMTDQGSVAMVETPVADNLVPGGVVPFRRRRYGDHYFPGTHHID